MIAIPEKKIRLRIILPAETKVDEPVDMVIMRCTTGDLGVLPGHEPRSAVLRMGIVRILSDGVERRIAVYGGLAVIKDDTLSILTNEAEWPEEVDLARAEANREHAERRLHEKTDDREILNDQLLLRRALVQIEVSAYAYAQQDE